MNSKWSRSPNDSSMEGEEGEVACCIERNLVKERRGCVGAVRVRVLRRFALNGFDVNEDCFRFADVGKA